MNAPTKTCTCCGATYDAAAWAALPLKGVVWTDDSAGRYRLELRNCSGCDSTLGVETAEVKS